MIKRIIEPLLQKRVNQGKILVVMGPRQTGKTTLVRLLMEKTQGKILFLSGDDPSVRTRLTDASLENLRSLVSGLNLLVIDEAQRIQNIGLTLKLLVDQFPQVQVIATGSSSFDLANAMNEPLTGRKFEFHLYPISWQEWEAYIGNFNAVSGLEQRMIFGMYPEVLTNIGEEKEVLASLTSSNLYKDLLSFSLIRKPEVLERLLQALALQLGSEVSYNEISNLLKINKETVANYITALEQAYIIFRLGAFSRNLRQEIATSRKIYFFDNGIRNALIGNFNPLALRKDVGALWENFLISERMKRNHYARKLFVNSYFWRTRQGQEIDYIEDSDGELRAYEFKWDPSRKGKFSQTFLTTYQVAENKTINRENFRDFLL